MISGMGDDGQISDVIFALRIVKNGIFRSTARVEASFPLFAVRMVENDRFWLRFRRFWPSVGADFAVLTIPCCRNRRFLRPCMRKATVSRLTARPTGGLNSRRPGAGANTSLARNERRGISPHCPLGATKMKRKQPNVGYSNCP